MSRTTDRADVIKDNGSSLGLWLCYHSHFDMLVIFRSYVRGFHKVTDREKYDRYYVMITEDRKSDFWQSVYRGAYERGQEM